MSYTLLSETKPIARKDHRCIWCGQRIPKGEQYVAERSVFDGDMQNHHWHNECLVDAKSCQDCEWEFMPYSNERPNVVTRRGQQYEQRIPCGKCDHVHLGSCSICNACEQIEPPK
jgi:hypothetical protein